MELNIQLTVKTKGGVEISKAVDVIKGVDLQDYDGTTCAYPPRGSYDICGDKSTKNLPDYIYRYSAKTNKVDNKLYFDKLDVDP